MGEKAEWKRTETSPQQPSPVAELSALAKRNVLSLMLNVEINSREIALPVLIVILWASNMYLNSFSLTKRGFHWSNPHKIKVAHDVI